MGGLEASLSIGIPRTDIDIYTLKKRKAIEMADQPTEETFQFKMMFLARALSEGRRNLHAFAEGVVKFRKWCQNRGVKEILFGI
jgi:hypothetical protein